MKSLAKLKKIKGDASFREFYRNKQNKSIVVVSKKERLKNLLIYDAINKILIKNKILAPNLLRENYINNYIEIKKLMGVSDQIAELNYNRFQSWKTPFTLENAIPCGWAFSGAAYKGLDYGSLSNTIQEYSQGVLRILSGLYGVLKPLDLIQPYRLEMGTKMKNERGKDLYEFWGSTITSSVNELAKDNNSKAIVNLASVEYFSVLKKDKLNLPIINPVFKDYKNGKYKIISFFAKKARGSMTRFIVQNKIKTPRDLKDFDLDGYNYSESDSEENTPVFLRKN